VELSNGSLYTWRRFVEERGMFESRLDLEGFDAAKFAPLVKELEEEGIDMSSLSSELQ